jgi:putative Holliday junction resolvase
MRVLCLDVGEKRVGVAVSDPMGSIAFGLETVPRKDNYAEFEKIKKFVVDKQVQRIVIGLPFDKKARQTKQTDAIKEYAGRLEAYCAPTNPVAIEFFDERFSTQCAHRVLDDADMRSIKRKEIIDTMSAQIILQDYLDAGKTKE